MDFIVFDETFFGHNLEMAGVFRAVYSSYGAAIPDSAVRNELDGLLFTILHANGSKNTKFSVFEFVSIFFLLEPLVDTNGLLSEDSLKTLQEYLLCLPLSRAGGAHSNEIIPEDLLTARELLGNPRESVAEKVEILKREIARLKS